MHRVHPSLHVCTHGLLCRACLAAIAIFLLVLWLVG